MPAVDVGFLVTCEHGGNRIPRRYAKAFAAHRALLDSHRGWDAGALALARQLAKALDAPLIRSETSRLLVDLNRSEHHRALFSAISRALPDEERSSDAGMITPMATIHTNPGNRASGTRGSAAGNIR